MKEKVKNTLKILLILAVICCIIKAIMFIAIDRGQYLNSIDYDVTLDENGDMKVVETWDIFVKGTNTLFKTFTIDKTKFSNITDVKVKEITPSGEKELTQIYEEMYHVTKDCYYGLMTGYNSFEIAWGMAKSDSSTTTGWKKYQISYVIEDAVTSYNDCQELYWSFLEQGENNIPAKKVTGRVNLPNDVSNIEKLRIWGHGQLNGTIEKANTHQVNFKMNGLDKGSRLEIRIVTEDKMFNVSSNKTNFLNKLNQIIAEETRWADESNLASKNMQKILNWVIFVYLIIITIYILKIIKIKNIKETKRIEHKIEYFREIPREKTVTPAEAIYLYKFEKERLETSSVQENAVSATILDLCLKRKITMRVQKENVFIKIVGDMNGLNKDEQAIYKLLKEAGGNEEFEIGQLKIYAEKEFYQYSRSINNLVNYARNSLYDEKLIDKAKEKSYRKYRLGEEKFVVVKYIFLFLVAMFLVGKLPFFDMVTNLMSSFSWQMYSGILIVAMLPLVGVLLYYFKMQKMAYNKIAVLTDKGYEEKEQWNGLVKYMKNYSLLNEKSVPDLVLWEKYLVYATALGISEKVVEELKATYPEVFIEEYWENEGIPNKYPVLDFTMNPIYTINIGSPISRIDTNVSSAYRTSQTEIARHSSSGRRRTDGGFSGGGGGRRWSVAGMGGR